MKATRALTTGLATASAAWLATLVDFLPFAAAGALTVLSLGTGLLSANISIAASYFRDKSKDPWNRNVLAVVTGLMILVQVIAAFRIFTGGDRLLMALVLVALGLSVALAFGTNQTDRRPA